MNKFWYQAVKTHT